MESPTYIGAYYPLDVDTTRGILLLQPNADQTLLQKITAHDGIGDVATVVDVNDISSIGTPLLWAARCQDDGSWLIWVAQGLGVAYKEGVTDCEVWRSVDAGANWTLVHSNEHGGPAGSGPGLYAQNGVVIYGDYKNIADAGCHHGWYVYYSENYGLTWDTIYTRPTPEAANNVFHWHGSVVDPDNTDSIYVWYGDTDATVVPYAQPPLNKLTKPTGWVTGDGAWTVTNYEPWESHHAFCYHSPGKWLMGDAFNWLWTPATSERERIFVPPRRMEDQTSYKYSWGTNGGDYCRAFYKYGNVFYMPISHYTANETNQNLNLVVSVDGRHWTTVNHLPATTRGWKAIHCFFDGYLWGWSQATAGGAQRLYKIPPIKAKTVNAIRVDYPMVNQLAAREDSTFTTALGAPSDGNWVDYGGTQPWGTWEVIAGGSDDSGHCGHGITQDYDLNDSCKITTIAQMATPLVSGDYFALAFDVWTGTNVDLTNHKGITANSPWTNVVDGPNSVSQYGTSRSRFVITGKATGVPTDTQWWTFDVEAYSDAVASVYDVYVDCAALYTSTTQWPSWAAFQPSGTARTAELVTIPLGGLGSAWSVAFDFQAGNSLDLIGDHAIATLHGAAGDFVELEFTAATETYTITDQAPVSATLGTAARRLWNDQVRVVITCDGTDTELHVYDAMSGEQTIGHGAGVLMTNGPPNRLVLGSNNDETVRGQGLFWGFKRWNKCLSSAEITAHWSTPGEGVAVRDIGR